MSVDTRHRVRGSRRQVAAIHFLANIRVEGETEEDLPGYNCLQGTEVLENYRLVQKMEDFFMIFTFSLTGKVPD